MKKKRSIGVVRRRGQLTIPDNIREGVAWLQPESVVEVLLNAQDEIQLRPYHQPRNNLTWERIKREMDRIRSFPGKDMDTTAFIAADRRRQ